MYSWFSNYTLNAIGGNVVVLLLISEASAYINKIIWRMICHKNGSLNLNWAWKKEIVATAENVNSQVKPLSTAYFWDSRPIFFSPFVFSKLSEDISLFPFSTFFTSLLYVIRVKRKKSEAWKNGGRQVGNYLALCLFR